MTTTSISITIDTNLLRQLDESRGLIPRSRFLSKIVADVYATKDFNETKSDDGDLGRAPVTTSTKVHKRSNDAR